MKVTISTIDEFDRQAHRLAKKYKSLKDDLKTLQQELMKKPCKAAILAVAFERFVWPLPRRARARVAVHGC